MALRYKEFVLAAEVMGEKKWRIILIEILPNLVSIVGGGYRGGALRIIEPGRFGVSGARRSQFGYLGNHALLGTK